MLSTTEVNHIKCILQIAYIHDRFLIHGLHNVSKFESHDNKKSHVDDVGDIKKHKRISQDWY